MFRKNGINPQSAGIIKTLMANVIAKIGIAIVVMLGVIYLVVHVLETSSKALKEIADGFNSGKVVSEFHDYITKMEGVNRLQVALIKSVDTFSKKDSKNILWDLISLPDVEVEIQAPVEYSYYLELNDKWEFRWNDSSRTIVAIAPKIKCGTPAVDVSNMKIIEISGSILRSTDEVKEKLKSELSQKLSEIAESKISLIRDTARNYAKQFIKNWFINFYFKDAALKPEYLIVYFADENPPAGNNQIIKLENKE